MDCFLFLGFIPLVYTVHVIRAVFFMKLCIILIIVGVNVGLSVVLFISGCGNANIVIALNGWFFEKLLCVFILIF